MTLRQAPRTRSSYAVSVPNGDATATSHGEIASWPLRREKYSSSGLADDVLRLHPMLYSYLENPAFQVWSDSHALLRAPSALCSRHRLFYLFLEFAANPALQEKRTPA